MTGGELYSVWCAALFVDWPRPRGSYSMIESVARPSAPVAWPFLNQFEQKGWDNLAEVLTARVEEDKRSVSTDIADGSMDFGGWSLHPLPNGIELWVSGSAWERATPPRAGIGTRRMEFVATRDELQSFLDRAYGARP